MGACVLMFCRERDSFDAMQFADPATLEYMYSTPETIAEHIVDTDLVIGAVLLVGARAPHAVTEDMVKSMQPGSVIVDVSIDQGGCIATSRPTTHSAPVYELHNVIHYCVTNMPGAYPRTASVALTGATLPYVLGLAQNGLEYLGSEPGAFEGVNTLGGFIACQPVAETLGFMDRYKPMPVPG